MAVTDAQYERILARLTKLENAHNDVVVAIEQFIDIGQMNQLLTLIQTQVTDLDEQVDALESRVTAIEEEPLS